MKLDKKYLAIGASIVGVVGVYLIVKNLFFNKQVQQAQDNQVGGGTNTPTNSGSTKTKTIVGIDDANANSTGTPKLPIKQGDRDKGAPLKPMGSVVTLQRLINVKGYIPKADLYKGKAVTKLVEDGIFGTKTEEALMFVTGMSAINTQADWDFLNNTINPKY